MTDRQTDGRIWGAEFAWPENDEPKIFNNWKMQDLENDGPIEQDVCLESATLESVKVPRWC